MGEDGLMRGLVCVKTSGPISVDREEGALSRAAKSHRDMALSNGRPRQSPKIWETKKLNDNGMYYTYFLSNPTSLTCVPSHNRLAQKRSGSVMPSQRTNAVSTQTGKKWW